MSTGGQVIGCVLGLLLFAIIYLWLENSPRAPKWWRVIFPGEPPAEGDGTELHEFKVKTPSRTVTFHATDIEFCASGHVAFWDHSGKEPRLVYATRHDTEITESENRP